MPITKSSLKRLEKLLKGRSGAKAPILCFEDYQTKRLSFLGKTYNTLEELYQTVGTDKNLLIITTYGDGDPLLSLPLR